jgi:hypothetical protein
MCRRIDTDTVGLTLHPYLSDVVIEPLGYAWIACLITGLGKDAAIDSSFVLIHMKQYIPQYENYRLA